MSLIKCSECGKEISDKAGSCPSCGNPTHNQSASSEDNKRIEIVQTSKKWKKTGLFALLILFIGFVTLSKSVGFGIFLIFIALIFAFITRIGAWWTNG